MEEVPEAAGRQLHLVARAKDAESFQNGIAPSRFNPSFRSAPPNPLCRGPIHGGAGRRTGTTRSPISTSPITPPDVRIPEQNVHPFRPKQSTDSDRNNPPIPDEFGLPQIGVRTRPRPGTTTGLDVPASAVPRASAILASRDRAPKLIWGW